MAFGVKTNERPGTRAKVRYVRMSAYKAREVLDLIRGKEVGEAEAILEFVERDAAIVIAQVPELRRRQRREQRRARRRRAVRLGLLRRRGTDAQAVAPPRPRPRHAHPQAHVPHHDHREPPVRGAARAAPAARGRVAGRAAPAAAPAAPRPSPVAARVAKSREQRRPHEHDHDRRARPRRATTDEEHDEPVAEDVVEDVGRRGATRWRPRSRSRPPRTETDDRRGRGQEVMGQKVNPYGFRLGVTTDWKSRWFAEPQQVPRLRRRGLEDPQLPHARAAARRDQPHRGRAHA